MEHRRAAVEEDIPSPHEDVIIAPRWRSRKSNYGFTRSNTSAARFKASVNARKATGGTAREAVEREIARARAERKVSK